MHNKKHTIKELTKKYEDDALDEEIIKKTLLKKARGFVLEEISEEYSGENEGDLRLIKRKVVSKEVAPDVNAIKFLLEMGNSFLEDYKNMTDEELLNEKNRLIKLLEEGEETNEFKC